MPDKSKIRSERGLTPLLAQYRRIKSEHSDALLLFRVGDFYEMFYEDAKEGARALDLTLTSRPHGPHNRVPLAGVPAKALDAYVGRLVAQGYKVAVCDQLEQPSAAKPVVRRGVVEIITPGTLTRPGLLDDRRNNYLMAISPAGDVCGLAFADVSTGEFRVAEVRCSSLSEEIQKVEPKEILAPAALQPRPEPILSSEPRALTPDAPGVSSLSPEPTWLDDYYFTQDFAFDKLTSHFGVANLEGFGVAELTEGVCAAGAVIQYLEQTQKTALPHIRKLTPYRAADYLLIDRVSRRNLELVERIHADSRPPAAGTLLSVLDRTRTPQGSRLLRRWVLAPLLDPAAISARHDAVEELTNPTSPLPQAREILAGIGDLERTASRVALERASAREIAALKDWLKRAPEIGGLLKSCASGLLKQLRSGIGDFSVLVRLVETTLVDDPPAAITEGGLIRTGLSAELDELRSLSKDTKGHIARLQETERRRTGIPNLRVGYNSVFGYYIEVTKSHQSLVPKNYLRKQTLAGAERYITPELKEYEAKVTNAEERIRALEHELFLDFRRRVGAEAERIIALSSTLAELDVLASLALVARESGYVRPRIDDSATIEIVAGRHLVVECSVGQRFIPNSTLLDTDEQQVLIITGPNMAGKSTYLRQTALIVIMAQLGSFVPAEKARIGVVDKIFTRIGASDDVAQGVSTFLAEMTETANILHNATSRSLVILDEVGRGTATNDGLAIAWAAVEYLHGPPERRPRTLFATHYHELTDIAVLLPRVRNYSFTVRETEDKVIFLRKLKPGPASKSYGIAVARLAGLPDEVILRAREVLAGFEQGEQVSLARLVPADDELRAADRQSRSGRPAADNPVLARLRAAKLDEISPLQALNLISELQRMVRQQNPDSD